MFNYMQIGNPTINDETDLKGMYEYYESHALISRRTLNRILRYCDFTDSGNGLSTQCLIGILESERNTAALDVYNIYAPICSTSPTNQVYFNHFFTLVRRIYICNLVICHTCQLIVSLNFYIFLKLSY